MTDEKIASTFPDFETKLLKDLQVGESVHVFKDSSAVDRQATTAAGRIKICITTKTMIVVDPVDMAAQKILVITRQRKPNHASFPEFAETTSSVAIRNPTNPLCNVRQGSD